jgi:DNA-directed RNA polymerase specialized sigma24 family protein
MFETPLAVAVALRRYGEVFDPRTGSVIGVSRGGRGWSGDPFRPGFLGAVEERAELVRRMLARLQPRERLLLTLWYVSDLQPTVIARQLQVSRVHCYRLRNKALRALCDVEATEASGDAVRVRPSGRRVAAAP